MDGKVKSVWRAVCLMGGLCVWGIAVDPAPGRAAVDSGSLSKMIFGKTPDGTPVELYVLKNGQITGKDGIAYRKHHAFCLEAQHYPDSIHHANFPSAVLEPGKTYTQTTIYTLSGNFMRPLRYMEDCRRS